MELGQDPELFWRLTLREISNVIHGVHTRHRRERNEALSIAWHTAAFSRVKKMPRLRDVLDEPKRAGRRMTPDELQSVVAGWLSRRKR